MYCWRGQVWWLCAGLFLILLWTTWRKVSQIVHSKRRSELDLRQETVRAVEPALRTAPSFGSTRGQACDVFICHRGPETKGGLVGHIKERLQRANLIVFVDYELRKGVESWPHVSATLRGARGVLMLLTPGFEDSPWCLEEARAVAARLDEARAAGAQQDTVLPVFIDRDTRWDERKLAAAFKQFSAERDFEKLRAKEPRSLAQQLTS